MFINDAPPTLFSFFFIGWDLVEGDVVLTTIVLLLPLSVWCKCYAYRGSLFWWPFLIYLPSYLSKIYIFLDYLL